MSVLTPIANKIAPSGSGVDSSWDCSRVDHILFDIHSGRIVPGLKHMEKNILQGGQREGRLITCSNK